MVYDTVVIECSTEGTEGAEVNEFFDGPENVNIKTTLDLVADAKCLHMVRNVDIYVSYPTTPLQGLEAVIERMRGAAGEWAGVRKLVLNLYPWGLEEGDEFPPAADYEDEIASSSSALAALMPRLREITFDDFSETPVICVLYGRLAGFYADQLQVLHGNNPPVAPQDRVFARLRDVKITGFQFESLEGKLPRLDPEVIESLVLKRLAANDMWSMFCADSDGCAITFPRLAHLDLKYRPRFTMDYEQLPDERPWYPQFPAAKRVRISSGDKECHSMDNAVFPNRLESLDISACFGTLSVFAGRKVHVSQNLTLSVDFEPDVNYHSIDIANRMLEAADSCSLRRLEIASMDEIPPELITYMGLTHLDLNGPTNADDVMELICRLPHLVDLRVGSLTLTDAQTDFSIPECTEHEPVAPLNTQIRSFDINFVGQGELSDLGNQMLTYLLLKIPTLKSITTPFVPKKHRQAIIDKYVQWYPHLANVKLV
ncbi:hypothetical protein H4R19_001256 [Coemansia spiralis]|nr:hypothetical protein H4R19_001256 [Coemansia spiralis]